MGEQVKNLSTVFSLPSESKKDFFSCDALKGTFCKDFSYICTFLLCCKTKDVRGAWGIGHFLGAILIFSAFFFFPFKSLLVIKENNTVDTWVCKQGKYSSLACTNRHVQHNWSSVKVTNGKIKGEKIYRQILISESTWSACNVYQEMEIRMEEKKE